MDAYYVKIYNTTLYIMLYTYFARTTAHLYARVNICTCTYIMVRTNVHMYLHSFYSSRMSAKFTIDNVLLMVKFKHNRKFHHVGIAVNLSAKLYFS